MNKLFLLVLVAATVTAMNTVFAYNENSKAARYYRGEISTEEYLDHLGVPKYGSQNQGTTRGTLRKNDIGEGYTYKDNAGKRVEYHKNPYGGYDVYSND